MKLGDIRREIKKSYKELQDWRKVAKKYDLTPAMAWRIAVQGYEPKNAQIRLKLGLPSMAPAPVCPYCGVVHVKKHCDRQPVKHRDWYAVDPEELKILLARREELT